MIHDKKQAAGAFLESIPDIASIIDTDGNVLMVNKAGAESVGKSVDEIIGRNLREIISEDVYELRRSKWNQVIQTGKMTYLEDERDGKYFETWFYPIFDAKGKVESIAIFAHNITNRKETEKAFKQSEEKFQLAMEVTNDALWDWNLNTNEVYRNPRHATMLGYAPYELSPSQDEWERRIHPDDRKLVFKILNEHLSGKRDSIKIEYRLETKSGDYIWILGRGKIVAYNEDGSPARIVGTNINITERKKQHEQDEIILKTCTDGFWLIDTHGRILEVNDAYCRMSGYSRDELLTMSIQDVEAAEEPGEISKHILEIKDKGSHRFESSHKRKDGKIIDLDISANFLELDGGRIFTFFRDITATKQVEKEIRKFKTIADKAGHGIGIADLQNNLVYVNDAYAQMHQYSADELIGKKISILHTEEQMDCANLLLDQIKQKGGFATEEVWHKRRDNTVFPTLMSATLIKDELGKPLFMAATAIDITEHKKAEESLKESELRYRTLFEILPVGVAQSTLDGRILDANSTFEGMIGYSIEQMRQINTLDTYYNPADRELLLKKFEQDGFVHDFEVQLKRKDGTIFLARLNATTMKISDETVIVTVAEDITEQKKTEEALQKSELRYRTLFETLPVGVGLTNPDGRITDANSTLLQMLDLPIKDIKHLNVLDLYKNPDNRIQLLKQLQHDGLVREFETEFKRKDGSTYFVNLNVTAMKTNNEIELVSVVKDTTEERLMKKTLADSEEKYRTLVESTRDPIATFDNKGVLLFANKEAADSLGYQPEDMTNKTMWDLFPKEIADRQVVDVRNVIETGRRINTVLQSRIRGQLRWFNTIIEPLKDEYGKTTAAMIVARDIDDIKHAEEQIKKLSLVVEQSIDGIAIGSLDGKLMYVNESYARMHGYTIEEMIGMKVIDLYPADKADLYEDNSRQTSTRGAWRFEIEHVRKDQSTFPAYLSLTLLKDDNGNGVGYIAVCRDMTEYRRTLEILRIKDAAIASSINGIAIGDPEGKLTYVNQAFLEMWGYENESEILGRNAIEFWKIQDEALRILETVMNEGSWIGELTAQRKDGSHFEVQVCVTLVKDENGRPISMMASFIDITETKRNEEELTGYRVQMARAEQLASLGTLSATVAHQLTQPLTVIRLSLDNALDELESSSSSQTVIKRLKDSVTQVSNITSIIENFRNFARKSSGRTVAEVNVKAVAIRIARLLSQSALSAGISLRIRKMDALPCPWMNENDMEQLFFALIENAIQAADGKKNRQLVISGAVKDQHIELRLSDDCGGIGPENIDKIFEPFFTTKPRGQGTGLGLCIVKDIVSRNGGQIRAESKFGKGTTFIIKIPIEKDKIS
jgi:PAS domain S-box-containing protein